MASNRIGKEIIETEHGKSEITFYGNSFIAGISLYIWLFAQEETYNPQPMGMHTSHIHIMVPMFYGLYCFGHDGPCFNH